MCNSSACSAQRCRRTFFGLGSYFDAHAMVEGFGRPGVKFVPIERTCTRTHCHCATWHGVTGAGTKAHVPSVTACNFGFYLSKVSRMPMSKRWSLRPARGRRHCNRPSKSRRQATRNCRLPTKSCISVWLGGWCSPRNWKLRWIRHQKFWRWWIRR